MRKTLLITILSWTTILGCVLIAWTAITDEDLIVAVVKVNIGNGLYMYKLDLLEYITNIGDTLSTITTIVPRAPTAPVYNWTDYLLAFKTIGKILLYIINWILYAVQIIVLVPLKFILYLITVMISLIGLNGSYIAYNLNRVYTFQIPYMQYSWLG